MRRKLLTAMLTSVIFCFSLGVASAKTISNPDTLKIGLKSLEASSISVTLEGHYKVNGTPMSDKTLNFKVSNGKISLNGSLYNEVYLEPTVSSSKVSTIASGKTNKYGGVILLKVSSGKILPINYIDMQSYLKGVLPYEISNSYPIEAIKSQAITSRTFALANLNKHKSEGIQLCDTTNCQVYKGENSSYKNIEKAVDETNNMVLTYNGSLASVTFGASNGGYTESSLNIWGSNFAYLPAKEDKYDKNPWPENKAFTTAEIESILKNKGYINSSDKFIEIGQLIKNSSARVSEMEVIYTDKNGTKNKKMLKKEEPRWALSLRSMMFDVNYNKGNDTYTFTGSGYGHGVGMSQIGAKARAADGQKSNEILSFYFPGTKIEAISLTGGEKPSLPPTNSGDIPEKPSTPAIPQDDVVAKNGTRGNVVKSLQGNLNYLGYSAGKADGIFGKNTLSAVKAFQKKEGLSQTGIVYESTINLLNKRVEEKKDSINSPFDKPVVESNIIAKLGTRGSIVKEVQSNLNYLGYNSGAADGIFGVNTEKALKSFQKAEGLSVSGVVNESTRSLLSKRVSEKKNSSTNAVIAKNGSKGQVVKEIQTALKKLGYNVGTIDGIYGKKTVNAVKAFQKAKKLSQTGVVDTITYKALI